MARVVTEVLAPAPLAAVLLLVVAWRSASSMAQGAVWGAVAVVFGSLFPMLFVLRGVRRGALTDHHVRLREQRPLPLLVGMACVLAGLGLMVTWRAPRDLLALIAAMLAGLGVSLLVSLFWKMSIHAGVAAGSLVILVLVFGPALLILLPVVVLVAWARIQVGDHTLARWPPGRWSAPPSPRRCSRCCASASGRDITRRGCRPVGAYNREATCPAVKGEHRDGTA